MEQTHLLQVQTGQNTEKRPKKQLRLYKRAIKLRDCLVDVIQEFRYQITRGEYSLDDVIFMELEIKRFVSTFTLYRHICCSLPNQEFVPKLPKKDFDLGREILKIVAVYKALKTVEPAGTTGKEDKCVICIKELVVGSYSDDVRALHCGHKFHEICIVRWLRKTNFCPLCRCVIIERVSHWDTSN